MRVINTAIAREDRNEVQMHLGALNAVLPAPDLNQMSVVVGGDGKYTLESTAEARVTTKLAWLVSHQLPSPTSKNLPSVAVTVQKACLFFGIELPDPPTGPGDVEGQTISR